MRLKFSDSKPTATKVAAVSTIAVCGHPLEANRSAKKQCTPCTKSRLAEEQAQAAVRRERRMSRKRLPDQSVFSMRYDAASLRWSGALVVDGVSFSSEAGSVLSVLRKLDMKYRDSLPEDHPSKSEVMVGHQPVDHDRLNEIASGHLADIDARPFCESVAEIGKADLRLIRQSIVASGLGSPVPDTASSTYLAARYVAMRATELAGKR